MNIQKPSTSDITIDGSAGEGGGQILRSSLSLSMITGRPLRVTGIRAGRKKPGLMKQHLTCVQAAAAVCGAEVDGAAERSQEILFIPGPVRPGRYHFQIGSAGSAMLVLQTLLPPLLTADGTSHLTVEGGTHNRQAPPFDFLQRSWLPLIERLGPKVTARLERYGFFPAGGGRVHVEVEPAEYLSGFDLLQAGRVQDRRVRALVSRLPKTIGERETDRVVRRLNWPGDAASVEEVSSNGPGNVLMAEVQCEHLTTLFSGFGQTGVPAERVADGVIRSVRSWMKSGAPVEAWLADQLMLPLALSAAQTPDCPVTRGGRFLTGPLTDHSRTQIALLPQFLDIEIRQQSDKAGHVLEFLPRTRGEG